MTDASQKDIRLPLIKQKPVLKLLIIALLAELGYAVMNISTMPVYLKEDRNFGTGTFGLVLAAYLISEAAFKSPMGNLADRYGPKKLMVLGPAISIFTAVLSIVVPHMDGSLLEGFIFMGLRTLDGLGAAMLWPAAFAAMNELIQDDERQKAMSLLNLCYLLGVAVAFEFGGIANDLTHTKFAGLILAAGCFFLVSIASYHFVPNKKTHATQPSGHEAGLSEFLACLHKIPEYLILAVITFAAIGFPMAIFKLFPTDQFGFSETQIGSLICPGAIVMGIATIPMGKVADRIGRERAVHLGLLLCTIGMAIIASGAFAVTPVFARVFRSPLLFCLGGIPVGVGFLLAIPAWMASVSDIDSEKRGSNLGAVMTAQGVGAIIGAPLGAAMYQHLQPIGAHLHLGSAFGRYSPFLASAICVGLGWLLSLRILKDKSKPESMAEKEDEPVLAVAVGKEG